MINWLLVAQEHILLFSKVHIIAPLLLSNRRSFFNQNWIITRRHLSADWRHFRHTINLGRFQRKPCLEIGIRNLKLFNTFYQTCAIIVQLILYINKVDLICKLSTQEQQRLTNQIKNVLEVSKRSRKDKTLIWPLPRKSFSCAET